tara:strand:- start:143 stop:691 length:549 start_codon:yes stop_codon:yes gene_type:complete
MVDRNRKDAESTEDILASIRKTMLEEPGKHLPDEGNTGGSAGDPLSNKTVVEKLRQLVDEYTDLPEDLVMAVTQLELEGKNSIQALDDDSFIELKAVSEETNSDGDRGKNSASELTSPDGLKRVLEEVFADAEMSSSLRNSKLDGVLALLLKVIAYHWLDEKLEPLVRKLVHAEVKRLSRDL